MNEQAGRVALVTGAARGIGKAISMHLAKEGAHVLVTDIDADAAARTVAEMKARGLSADAVTLDVTDSRAERSMVDELHANHGRIDILVSNAGAGKAKPFLDVTEAELAFQMSLNFSGVYAIAQACAQKMRAAGYGRVVLVSSVTGLAGPIDLSAYGSMKAGQFGLMRAMALELAEHGITTNAVAPGPIDTELLRAAWADDMIADAADRIPLRRIGKPEDVAYAVGFLASPQASFLNGVTIAVDGGFTAAGGYMSEIYRRRKMQKDAHPEHSSC
ncbi:SDR family oxidoreductase [Paraburkholderia dipogonis]|uniref:SDR family oxidoreductase n=1 Tax=Paraburkholderia dipogonis TaxID=1211383 RepID=A0A4Y8NBN5_9BURK|nr:SDR family NAD(P)-dependent oxidoreductase [Paraburkholderia dipogonis]TFE46963.1 SDR family oxidoreductase [Paraburkholderia dipogonis]